MDDSTLIDVSISSNVEIKQCTSTACIKDEEFYINTIQCKKCEKYIHYACTKIPAYQLQSILNKPAKSRNWHCINCVVVSEELESLLPKESDNILKLQREVKNCESLVIAQKETIIQQEYQIKQLKESLQAINKNTTGFEKRVEKVISKRFQALQQEFHENVEKKLEAFSQTTGKTFAETVKINPPTSLRAIIKETKNEEQQEEREKKARKKNIIIHGVKDPILDDKQTKEDMDKSFVKSLLDEVNIQNTPLQIERIGIADPLKSRPLKVAFYNQREKDNLMKNLKLLKGKEMYKGISITEDFTRAEREMLKSWALKAKEKNENEAHGTNIVWRVRGSPRTTVFLKKIILQEHNSTH